MKVLFVLHGHNFLRELLTTKSIPSKGHHMSCTCSHPTHLLLCLTFETFGSLVLPKGAFMDAALPGSFPAGDITAVAGKGSVQDSHGKSDSGRVRPEPVQGTLLQTTGHHQGHSALSRPSCSLTAFCEVTSTPALNS